MSKHTPGPRRLEITWSLGMPWAWTGKPSARDLNDHGGAVVIRPSPPFPFPIEYRVHGGSSVERWVVSVVRVVGTTHPGESIDAIDGFDRFGDALTEAKRLCRAVIAKAEGKS